MGQTPDPLTEGATPVVRPPIFLHVRGPFKSSKHVFICGISRTGVLGPEHGRNIFQRRAVVLKFHSVVVLWSWSCSGPVTPGGSVVDWIEYNAGSDTVDLGQMCLDLCLHFSLHGCDEGDANRSESNRLTLARKI